jgi:NAD+ kinase
VAALKQVGILAHPQRPQTAPAAAQIQQSLQGSGLTTWLETNWEETTVREAVSQSQMVVAIGGDGAMLRAARVCAPYAVPVLGVNMGHLGFLTALNWPDGWENGLRTVQDGNYWIEARMMIQAQHIRAGEILATGDALNDVVVSRGVEARTVQLETYIDQGWATTYNADALIIATATGSTAYALAAGGPILPPELRNILLVPVAPHLSMDRPLVLSEGVTVEIFIPLDCRTETVLTVDGVLTSTLLPGDRVRIYASQHVSRFVRLGERNYFYRSLLDRLEPRISARLDPRRNE